MKREKKYLGMNLLKKQKTYIERAIKDWWEKLKKRQIDGEIYHVTWIRRINIVKMRILPRVIYRFSAIPIKLSTVFFRELDKAVSQFV